MDKRILTAAASAAILMGAAPASALVIDDFVTPQFVEDTVAEDDVIDGVDGVGSEVAAVTAIGGYRDLYVEKLSGPTDSGVRARVTDDILSFSNDSLVTGAGYITWDGDDDDPFNVDTDGLGGYNLLAAGNFFDFEVIEADHMLDFTMTVWDMAGGISTYFEELPPVEQLETRLFFSQFTGTADFSDVGAIQIFVTGDRPSLDASIGEIEVIPLPASALLLLGGIGGLGALRARRRSA